MSEKPPVSKFAANLATTSILAEVFVINSFHYLLPVFLWIKTQDLVVSTLGFAIYLICYGVGLLKIKLSKALNALRIIGSSAGFAAAFLFIISASEEWYFIIPSLAALGVSAGGVMAAIPTIKDPVHSLALAVAPFAVATIVEQWHLDIFMYLGLAMLIFGIFIYLANLKVFLPRKPLELKLSAPKEVLASAMLLPIGIYTITALLPLYGYWLLKIPLSIVGGICFLALIVPFAIASYLSKGGAVVGPEILSSFVLVKIAFLIMAIYVYEAWHFLLVWVGLVVLSSLETSSFLAIVSSTLKDPKVISSLALILPLFGGLGCLIAASSWLVGVPKLVFIIGAAPCLISVIVTRHHVVAVKRFAREIESA
ncbi:MAG: hypothetical protein DRJ31_01655 [Candidatus Methanomethylicota archaeon]|uniref:Uncharacterized protein n=1 Tax=Thermoproteota archaeon TaxID=2056631 RepID=A0A497ETM8_9CREN|nr:MAG: hypothetical protein DRJ31_01655 [Candidatus Verstraetearchaeota archaeon]